MQVEIGFRASSDNQIGRSMAPTGTSFNVANLGLDMPVFTVGSLPAPPGNNTTNAYPFILIMSGAMPADPNSLTTLSAGWDGVTKHALVNWGLNTTAGGVCATTTLNTINFDAPFRAADRSGEATWFWIGMARYNNSDFNYAPVYHSIIGSIGVFGSGADLECQSTSVLQGNTYRLAGLKVTFPMILEF